MAVTIALPRTLNVGAGSLATAGDLLATLGATRPLIVTDTFLSGNGTAQLLVDLLEQSGCVVAIWDGTVPDPTTDSLRTGVAAAVEHRADIVIGLGGGSPIDTAKALALLAVSGGEMRDYKSPRVVNEPALPVIAIPTTAGSGSEATRFAIITESATHEKMLCSGPSFLPIAAIIDSDLTLSMPPRLTADTGIDALTHAIEAFVSVRANPFSDSFARAAMPAIARNIERVVADGSDGEARGAMMLAATQAGIAFSNSSVALVHGMSRPIGAHFGIAHGMSNAMLFPAVTAFSIGAATARYAECARLVDAADANDTDDIAAAQLVDYLERLNRTLEVPTPRDRGIDRLVWDETIPIMAAQALASGSPQNNPRVPSTEEIADLYGQIYG